MKRTTDIAFAMCPICGKRPYIKVIDVNYGMAYCKGNFLKRHLMLKAETGYCTPSMLYKTLSKEWDKSKLQQNY